tara:strand:- start:227 stop:385 length:159 start_codon:yes stop_codon:yes gene_type:complete
VNEQLTELDREVVEWLVGVFMLCRKWGDSGDLIDMRLLGGEDEVEGGLDHLT